MSPMQCKEEGGALAKRRRLCAGQDIEPRRRSVTLRFFLTVCAGLLFLGFVALGTWQIQRLHWKLDLIARVDRRVHAPAVDAPDPGNWPQVNANADEYRHVRVTGVYLYALTVKVQAATELGSGFWLLTPMRLADGRAVLVNRGFIAAAEDARNRQAGRGNEGGGGASVSGVTGLLRMSEPGGAFLRHNDPSGNRWYSRDVQAIAAARGLSSVAPYFIDADASAETQGKTAADLAAGRPVGGLTVISFYNNHLVYALTWYALALMVAGAGYWIRRWERNVADTDGDNNDAARD